MRILISNDDGIYSPGLAALATVAMRFSMIDVTRDAAGRIVHSAGVALSLRFDAGGGSEVDPAVWWRALCRAVDALAAGFPAADDAGWPSRDSRYC